MKVRFLALAALVLGMVSCQHDFDTAVHTGEEVDFKIMVAAPELCTRADLDADSHNGHNSAYGAIDYVTDWSDVDLRYTLEVYDVDEAGNLLSSTPVKERMEQIVDHYQPVSFDLRLVPNRQYRFVVFADFVDTNGEGMHHAIGQTLADIQLTNDGINDEYTDAYFDYENITISTSATQNIVLTRPYGKLRVVATDLAELNLNTDPGKVLVNYSTKQPQVFDAVTGTISEYEEVSFEYEYAPSVGKYSLADYYYTEGYDAMVEDNLHTHMTLFTDYILATDTQEPIHFTMTVLDKEGVEIKTTDFNTEIPIKRNNLTTILGNVLTISSDISITIDDSFSEQGNDYDLVFVSSARELQEALDQSVDGQTIIFSAPIEGDVVARQKEGVSIVVDGNKYKYDGVITINGDARAAGQETLTLKNIHFETSASDFTFITAPSKVDGRYNYSHNVTIENCTFEGNHTVGSASFIGTYNLSMVGCTATNMHSLLQVQSCDNSVDVESVAVVGCKNGVSFGNTAFPTIKNSKIEAEGYGVRVDGDASRGNLVVENLEIDAKLPVIARRVTTPGYVVNFQGSNVLNTDGYQVIFTQGSDSETFVAPEVGFVLNGADGFVVFPRDAQTAGFVYNADELQSALVSSLQTIKLQPGVYEGAFTINRAVEIIGSDATIVGRVSIVNANPTFSGVKFDRNDTDSDAAWDRTYGWSNCLQYKAVVMIYGNQLNKITFQNCEFYNNLGVNKSAITNVACELIVDNCYFEGRSSAIYSQCNLSITNSTFNYTGSNNVIASINGCGDAGGKFVFKNNQSTGDKIFALSQFLSTTGFGNGNYYFDVDTTAEFDYYFLNEGRVTNKSFAEGSVTF